MRYGYGTVSLWVIILTELCHFFSLKFKYNVIVLLFCLMIFLLLILYISMVFINLIYAVADVLR